jgi:2-polyprenyl-3-methyl-5-hydroxy-6-metoxy-1,4-benzoquinol methylase
MNKVKVNSGSKSKKRMSNLTEFRLLLKQYSNYMDELIEHDYRGYKEINDRITERFGIELKGLKILEIGCGQRYPHILMYSNQNDVIGIDLDIILNRWSPVLIIKMLIKKGVKRTGKTVIRKALFDKKYYRKLKKRSGMKLNGSPKIINISADSTKFNDNEFDFITSYNVFEHIENVEGVVKEMKRILKPGFMEAIIVLIYTKQRVGPTKCRHGITCETVSFHRAPTLMNSVSGITKEYSRPISKTCIISRTKPRGTGNT